MTDMIKIVGFTAGGFIIGIIVMALVMKMVAPKMMIHEEKSPYDFDTTVDTIRRKYGERGLEGFE
jgi:hypothetical protein